MRTKECGYTANWNWVIISTVVVAVCTLLLIYAPQVKDFDWDTLKWVQNILSPFPDYIPLFFSEFGRDYSMFWPQFTACAVLVSHRYYLKAFLLVFFTQASYALSLLIKDIVCRERPCGDAYPGFSYPSCHAATSVCFLGICMYLIMHYVQNRFWKYFMTIFLGVFALCVCISRMWINHHFPIDVISGTFLGVLLFNLYIILCKFFSK